MNPKALPQVVILAGGLATRLRPLTETIPKALLEINGEPFLAHQLRLLASRNVTRVVLAVGYRGEQIREYAGSGQAFGVQLDYSFDGPRLLGTAGAIRNALPFLEEVFFVLYGDSYLPCDYSAAAQSFSESGKPAMMTVYRNDGRWDASNVEFRDGRIMAYDKLRRTPEMLHIDYGLGIFRRPVFEAVPEGASCDLATVYQDLLRRNELAGWESPERFYEVGSPAGLRELAEALAR